MRTFQVLVVDDHKAWRALIVEAMGQMEGVLVVGETADGLSAVQQAKRLSPDLIVLDIGLPVLNGIEAIKRIRLDSPCSKILCVSENQAVDIVETALEVGATGYLLKHDAGSDLLTAVAAVLQGKRFVSAGLAGPVLVRSTANPKKF